MQEEIQMAQTMQDILEVKQRANLMLSTIGKIEIEQQANIRAKQKLEEGIAKLMKDNTDNREALDIATHAIEILNRVSDDAVSEAYKFIEENLNSALARMFENTTRQIKLHEYMRSNQYPQLEIQLVVGNGKTRSLKADSGHGIAQIVSLLSILSLIVLTNSRRILVMDEVISGLSVHNRKIVSDILWQFTEIGFQFIVNEHGFVPKGSKVYYLEMVGDVSHVKETYIESQGVYLNNTDEDEYGAGYTRVKSIEGSEGTDQSNQLGQPESLGDAQQVISKAPIQPEIQQLINDGGIISI